MDQLVLYNYFRSSTSFRVRLALEIKKLSYQYKAVHLLNNGGEQHQPEYRKLNAMGGVPTLVHNVKSEKRIIGQSMAIIQYLDDAFPETHRLFPTDPWKKSLVLQFCENINADTHAYGNLRTLQYLEKNFSAHDEQKQQWVQHWTLAGLNACEKMLEKHAGLFSFGNDITAADTFLIPQVISAQRFKVPMDQFKMINQVFNHCVNIESFKKAHPFRQIDTPPELKID